ncbi:MAG: transposase [Oscillospiraceae bacterium]
MANKDSAPRRWTPKEAQGMIGRLIVPSMLLVMLAVSVRTMWLLIPAAALWVVMLLILYKYWRCPRCGKTLPKMGKVRECPKCGAEID